MHARHPDVSGSVTRDGVTVGYDVYGDGHSPTVVLLPTWAMADSEHWKAQTPVLARRYRVIVVHGRRRPPPPAAGTASSSCTAAGPDARTGPPDPSSIRSPSRPPTCWPCWT